MLYVIYGENFKKSRANLKGLTNSLLKKKPDSNLFRLSLDTLTSSKLEEFVGGQGLFEQKYIVVLDKCFEDKDKKELIFDQLKEISESKNVFIIIEEKIDSKTLSKLEKKADKIYEYKLKEVAIKENFKLFTLTDALGSRDKKRIWVELQKALMKSISAEEIHSMLLWQTRSMILASGATNATISGLKPFVYNKSKRFAGNYSTEELNGLYKDLVEAYHKARRGESNLSEKIELVLLGIS